MFFARPRRNTAFLKQQLKKISLGAKIIKINKKRSLYISHLKPLLY